MVSHKKYHLNANEEYFISLTSILITYFIDGFTSGMKSNSFLFLFYFFETQGQHANARLQEAVDHLTSIMSSGEEISQPAIEANSSSLIFEYPSTIIQ